MPRTGIQQKAGTITVLAHVQEKAAPIMYLLRLVVKPWISQSFFNMAKSCVVVSRPSRSRSAVLGGTLG